MITDQSMNSLDKCFEKAQSLGLHDRSNHALRVKWINALRTIVSRRVPKNKMGNPLVNDVDLMTATADEMAESFEKL